MSMCWPGVLICKTNKKTKMILLDFMQEMYVFYVPMLIFLLQSGTKPDLSVIAFRALIYNFSVHPKSLL